MGNKIMQETTPLVECSAFHRGMSVLEASLRNTEDSETIISGLLKGAAEFYGASRASVVEADWDLGIGVITYEWCKDGVPAQRDMLQCLLWGDRIFEKCGIGRDEGGDGGKTLEIRGKRRLSARDKGANYQQS